MFVSVNEFKVYVVFSDFDEYWLEYWWKYFLLSDFTIDGFSLEPIGISKKPHIFFSLSSAKVYSLVCLDVRESLKAGNSIKQTQSVLLGFHVPNQKKKTIKTLVIFKIYTL